MKFQYDQNKKNRKLIRRRNRRIKFYQIHLAFTLLAFIIVMSFILSNSWGGGYYDSEKLFALLCTLTPLIVHHILLFGIPGVESKLKEMYNKKHNLNHLDNMPSSEAILHEQNNLLEDLTNSRFFNQEKEQHNPIWKENDFV